MAKEHDRRRQREARDRAMFGRMQRAIDKARRELWTEYFGEYAEICGSRTAARYVEKFNEAWARSAMPNTYRDDMTANGNYRDTGRDVNGNDQDALDARSRAAT